MNDRHVKGTISEMKGKAKEEIGHRFGKEKMEMEGLLERGQGKVQKKIGDWKDAIRQKADELLRSKNG